jgi:hypothetical protein
MSVFADIDMNYYVAVFFKKMRINFKLMRKVFQIIEKYFQINEKRENNYWEKAVENTFLV